MKNLCSTNTHLNVQTESRSAWMLLNLLIYINDCLAAWMYVFDNLCEQNLPKMYTCTLMHVYIWTIQMYTCTFACTWTGFIVHYLSHKSQAEELSAGQQSLLFTNIFDFVTPLISSWSSRQSHGSSEAWKRWGWEWRSSSKAKSSLLTKHSFESKKWYLMAIRC